MFVLLVPASNKLKHSLTILHAEPRQDRTPLTNDVLRVSQ